MTDQDQLDALAAAATPGPFSEEGGYIKAGKAALTTVADLRYKNGSADRAFIVALVNAYPDLRAAVRERDELRAAAEAVIADWEGTDEDEEYLSPEFAPKLLALRAALHPETTETGS